MVRLSRRTILLAGSAWAFAGGGECNVSTQTTARPSLPIPPELRADAAGSIKLEAQTGTMRFLGDRETATYGVNGPYLGPALRLRRGETVTVQVTNNVPENITMHWHGLIIPADVDGAEEEKSLAVPAHGHLRYRLTPRPSGARFVHTHVMPMADLNRGTYTGQFGFVYIEPKNNPGQYDQEIFLATHEWEPYFTTAEEEEEDDRLRSS